MTINSAITVRLLKLGDLPAVLGLQASVYPPSLHEDRDALSSRIKASASYCLAAMRGRALVGYLLAHGWKGGSPPAFDAPLHREETLEVLFIHDLAVSTAVRGTGTGRRLIECAFERAAANGLRCAELIAVEGAAGYWRQFGFVEGPPSPELTATVAGYGAGAHFITRELQHGRL